MLSSSAAGNASMALVKSAKAWLGPVRVRGGPVRINTRTTHAHSWGPCASAVCCCAHSCADAHADAHGSQPHQHTNHREDPCASAPESPMPTTAAEENAGGSVRGGPEADLASCRGGLGGRTGGYILELVVAEGFVALGLELGGSLHPHAARCQQQKGPYAYAESPLERRITRQTRERASKCERPATKEGKVHGRPAMVAKCPGRLGGARVDGAGITEAMISEEEKTCQSQLSSKWSKFAPDLESKKM